MGKMERIKRVAGETAKFGVKLFIIAQDISQLKELYGVAWETFIANSGKGQYKTYPYYLCHHKGCASYGKSIKRDKLEEEFVGILQNLQPNPSLIKIGEVLFKRAWEQFRAHRRDQHKGIKADIKSVDKTIDSFLTRIVEADNFKVIKAYETKIATLEMQKMALNEKLTKDTSKKKPYEESVRTAVAFLLNPSKLWVSGNAEEKRKVVQLAFGRQLAYCRNEGFRTVSPSLPFQIIQGLSGKLGNDNDLESVMVRPRG